MALKLKVEFKNLQSVFTTLNLKALTQFQNLKITDVFIDSDSKNLYFFEGNANAIVVNISESLAFAAEKTFSDSAVIAELAALESGLIKGDIATVTESIAFFVVFSRQFSDSLSVSENSIQDFDAGKSDTANIAENYSSLFTTSRADSSTISESAAVVRNKTFGAPYYNTNAYTTSNVALVNYTVTVAPKSSGSGNAFYFNGMEQLNFNWELHGPVVSSKSLRHKFDVSDSSLSGHPLKFSAYDDGSHNSYFSGTYPDGSPIVHYPIDENVEEGFIVSGTQGQAGAYIEWTVGADHYTYGANPIYYYCANHSGMGGRIDVQDDMHLLLRDNQFSKQVDFVRTFTDATSLDDTASASDDLATESGINKNNVVSPTESLGPFAVSKPFADSTNISENISIGGNIFLTETTNVSEAFAFQLGPESLANSVSVSESINVQLFVGDTSGALLNKSALNTFSINS